MIYMFRNCYNLNDIDISSFIIDNNTLIEKMFDGCDKLKAVKINKKTFNKLKKIIDINKLIINN